MVRSGAVVVAMPIREGFSYEVENAKGHIERFPCLPMIRAVHSEPLSLYVLRISSAGPIVPGVIPFCIRSFFFLLNFSTTPAGAN
jgi:hypothetical protein